MISTWIAASISSSDEQTPAEDAIEFDVTGDFNPRVFVDTVTYPDATVLWTAPDDSTSTSLEPSFTGTGAGVATLAVTPWAALQTIVLRHTGNDQDGGGAIPLESLFPVRATETQRNVTAIRNLSLVRTTLQGLAISGTGISELDLQNFTALQRLEAFSTPSLVSLRVTGCVNLHRLCIENDHVAGWQSDGILDARGIDVWDWRGAYNSLAHVYWTDGILADAWHICIRAQSGHRLPLAEFPLPAELPACRQLLVNSCAYSGVYDLSPWDDEHPNDVTVWLDDTQGLTGITPGYAVTYLDASSNAGLNEAAIDSILDGFVTHGRSGGYLDLRDCVPPSAAGLASVATLQSRGWTVLHDSAAMATDSSVVLLHHSTGGIVYDNGVASALSDRNTEDGTTYTIASVEYPSEAVPWANYPHEWWYYWVDSPGAGGQTTLATLCATYDVIVFKCCYPVSEVVANSTPDITSEVRSDENYRLQMAAVFAECAAHPNNRFVFWTGALHSQSQTTEAQATRALAWFNYLRTLSLPSNVYLWDFAWLESHTEAERSDPSLAQGLYALDANTVSETDSHPTAAFGASVAPLFVDRVISVLEGTGRSTSILGL
jgi:hypothetical protein